MPVQDHYIHRLVATHFVPNPNKYKYVEHIDGDLKNNNADNLRWVEDGGDKELFTDPSNPKKRKREKR